ncbi:hypothetical protein L1277_001226 [Okibacterium sp. HSC-33S16]|uniref:DUF308 domain-containing protein n=1 Tax=Okibacterium sp. HSC-33S16 TaxID=2910965 RepID=UPI0020A22FBC|nr:DUF308 domain-containing protein [Okibacterium sp. HSC-33S16]MCP2031135.1 hypothetical protein [Okibacterium sp. HSC-33S16]
MTNSPPSPYGPADPAGQGQNPLPSPTPQPPYSAAHYYPQPQLPYGYTAVGPTPPKRSNGPGLAALIIGIGSIVVAFIPIANFFSFLLGPAGVIVGIVGLALADRPRRQAIWGLVLSGVSMIVAFIMIFVYTFGFIFAVGGAVDEYSSEVPRSSEEATEAPFSAPIELLPLGTVVDLLDEAGEPAYEATVTASVVDATEQVLGNARNIEAPAGMQWALARVTVTSLSATHTSAATEMIVEYVSPDGHSFSPDDEYVIAPEPEFALLPDLNLGESTTGNVVIAVPVDDPTSGYWALSYDDGDTDTEPFYFEVG